MHIGESEDDSYLAAGSYGVSMLGAGGGSSWAPVETPSEVWAEARGAVAGSVLGAAALIALLVWYFLRCVRAVRGNYAIDLQDEGEVEPLSAMEALVHTSRHESTFDLHRKEGYVGPTTFVRGIHSRAAQWGRPPGRRRGRAKYAHMGARE